MLAETGDGRTPSVQRYKGLGGGNEPVAALWDTTMNPDTRIMLRVDLGDAAAGRRDIYRGYLWVIRLSREESLLRKEAHQLSILIFSLENFI